MANTYAINTVKSQEFRVETELLEMGLHPWVPRRLEAKNVKEKKEPIWYDRAYVPKLMFCVIPAVYFRDVLALKHVIGKPFELSRRDMEGQPAHVNKATGKPVAEIPGLNTFRRLVEAEYADAERRRANNEYQCLYTPGQALEVLRGPFEGFQAEFQKVIQNAHDEYAKLRVDVNIFGRQTSLEVSPDMVRLYQ